MRYIKHLLSTATFFVAMLLKSQVMVTSHAITPLSCSEDRMLDIVLSNSTPEAIQVNITAVLSLDNGSPLCVVNAFGISVPMGVTSFRGSNIPHDYRFSEHPVAQYLSSSGKLLAGSYEICYEITTVNSEFPSRNCFPLLSSFSSFLQLIYPMDKQVIEELNPMLTWTHSGLLPTSDSRETFELLLVEKNKDQSAAQAISENALQLNITDLKSHTLLYPLNSAKLLEGHQYAWQVIHRFDGMLLESSDYWWFEIGEWEDPRDVKYVDITASKSSDIVTVYNSFYFRFDEAYNEKDIHVFLYNNEGKLIEPATDNDSSTAAGSAKKNGFNGYRVNLSVYNLKAGNYKLQVANAKGEKYIVNIHYKK
ncbi:MAG: hypothetical protein ACKVOK_12615 [Flavobacteriales bacterium]